MEITLYNTCPAEYDKKFSQILKKIIRPAIRAGRSVRVDEIPEEITQKVDCMDCNYKSESYYFRKPSRCKSCPIGLGEKKTEYANSKASIHYLGTRRHSDLTMKITII